MARLLSALQSIRAVITDGGFDKSDWRKDTVLAVGIFASCSSASRIPFIGFTGKTNGTSPARLPSSMYAEFCLPCLRLPCYVRPVIARPEKPTNVLSGKASAWDGDVLCVGRLCLWFPFELPFRTSSQTKEISLANNYERWTSCSPFGVPEEQSSSLTMKDAKMLTLFVSPPLHPSLILGRITPSAEL